MLSSLKNNFKDSNNIRHSKDMYINGLFYKCKVKEWGYAVSFTETSREDGMTGVDRPEQFEDLGCSRTDDNEVMLATSTQPPGKAINISSPSSSILLFYWLVYLITFPYVHFKTVKQKCVKGSVVKAYTLNVMAICEEPNLDQICMICSIIIKQEKCISISGTPLKKAAEEAIALIEWT
ncbi:UNVERIFIED_CONTAM: hypothetical protein K2H54_061752 [Gekko kuhli]